MSLNRQTAKTLFRTLDKYEAQKKMVLRAIDPVSPTLEASLGKNRANLDETYLDLVHHFKEYKRDINQNGDVLNQVETDGSYKYEHNDAWMETLENAYYDIAEKSDLKLAAAVTPASDTSKSEKKLQEEAQSKQLFKQIDSLTCQITSLTGGITASIDKIAAEVRTMGDGAESPSKVQFLRQDLQAQSGRIKDKLYTLVSQLCGLLSDSECLEKKSMRDEFVKREQSRIDNLLMQLSNKVKEPPVPSSTTSVLTDSSSNNKNLYLKKTDPPTWDGDVVNFAEFVRKWKNQVSAAKLPEEQELDRLRECIPSQASKSLFGESTMIGAWKVLEELYGDKDIIANLLKSQLKNIKAKSKVPHDVVIEIVTEVKNIVLRLKALDMEEMLHVDNEFLGAVYRALPDTFKSKWLDFDKSVYRSKWAGFTKFMDVARDQALQNKVLLSSYDQPANTDACRKCNEVHGSKKCPVANINSSKVKADSSNSDKQDRVRKAKSDCGICPLCRNFHTFNNRKENMQWPSDRL